MALRDTCHGDCYVSFIQVLAISTVVNSDYATICCNICRNCGLLVPHRPQPEHLLVKALENPLVVLKIGGIHNLCNLFDNVANFSSVPTCGPLIKDERTMLSEFVVGEM